MRTLSMEEGSSFCSVPWTVEGAHKDRISAIGCHQTKGSIMGVSAAADQATVWTIKEDGALEPTAILD
jgi:hypothetical protein